MAIALVLRSRLRQAVARGSRAAVHAEEAIRARGRLQDRNRARRQQAEDRHLYLAARHHHRPQGDRGRQAEAGNPEADQPRGLHQYSGDPETGARRAAHLGVGGDAARKARGVPPGDAQGRRVGAALRRAWHQGARLGTAERCGDRALGMVPPRPAPPADAPRGHRLRLRRSEHDIRADRYQGVAVQGRASRAAAWPRRGIPGTGTSQAAGAGDEQRMAGMAGMAGRAGGARQVGKWFYLPALPAYPAHPARGDRRC